MKLQKGLAILLVSLGPEALITACPFSISGGEAPDDDVVHNPRNLRRRLTALADDPDGKAMLKSILENRRHLQADTDCLSEQTYDAIHEDIVELSAAFPDDVSRAHILGGIVRLAAHDFMDFNQTSADFMGADGCIDMGHPSNAGLPEDIWCPTCDLRVIYESKYLSMSKADFWIAAANAVIKLTSSDGLDLKSTFLWGRTDAVDCVDSATRLPAASSCTEVKEVFLDRMGLSWTDAVALIGAHTLGRGSASFSGHDGIWLDTVEESVVFDKRYYEELFRRAWIPRNLNTDVQDWTWGNQNNDGSPRFMLNTDMCLFYEFESPESAFPCCSRTDLNGANGNPCDRFGLDLSNTACNTIGATSERADAAAAIELFAGRRTNGGFNNDNQPFYDAFASAWSVATSNGWSELQPLASSCDPTTPTTSAPSRSPSKSPSQAPTDQPTSNPTKAPITSPPTASPITPSPTNAPTTRLTQSPVTSAPTASCEDEESFENDRGKVKDCAWVIAGGRCRGFAHLCPVSCGECDCLLNNRVCSSGADCCSGSCSLEGACVCRSKGVSCEFGDQCCSGNCKADGKCGSKLFD
ncbi:hypothetical protein ACHAWF_010331 [Thalassiosira exigua]